MLTELLIPAADLEVVKHFNGEKGTLGHFLKSQVFNPDNPPVIAIVGIPEGRGSFCRETANATDVIRAQLYTLSSFSPEIKIIDFGNIRCGNCLKDTYAAVRLVTEELLSLEITVLLIGGSQDCTIPIVSGSNSLPNFDLVIVDDRIDNNSGENPVSDENFIDQLPEGTSVSVIAAQSYFLTQQDHDLFAEGYNGEVITLGKIRHQFKELEPLIRNANLVSFDIGSVKAAEGPGQYRISPNGLSGEEACQIAWYAGISTSPVWFGMFGYAPIYDSTRNGAMLAAQICWYFLYGKSKKTDNQPIDEATDFDSFHIEVEGLDEPITFLRHPVSKRWWMEVPSDDCTIFPVRIPCSKIDYKKACNNEIPERWWKYFNKLY